MTRSRGSTWLGALGLLLSGCFYPTQDFDGDGLPDVLDCAPDDPVRAAGLEDTAGDGIDQDCDGVDGVDDDGDGAASLASGGADCDDQDSEVRPGAVDVPEDGIDQDCDGSDAVCDGDGDGAPIPACGGADCDDADATVHPGALEVCDGRDDDCDGQAAGEQDADADGAWACVDCDDLDPTAWGLDEDGWDPCAGDCDESASAAHPGASDPAGEGIDSDCDGVDGTDRDHDGFAGNSEPAGLANPLWDCDDLDAALHRRDADGDGWDPCEGDCDDALASTSPQAADTLCDGVDTDCDGSAAELDRDGDGFRPCSADCDDGDPALNPADGDGDGFSPCAGDCDDADPAINPGAIDAFGDGADPNCDGVDGTDADGDGFAGDTSPGGLGDAGWDCDDTDPALHRRDEDGDGWDPCAGDCDDADANRAPGRPDPFGAGGDTNCDGIDGVDLDGDGAAGNATPAELATLAWDCDDADPGLHRRDDDGDGWDPCTGDCDDADPTVLPGAPEVACDGVDSNCDGAAAEQDRDGDGAAPCAGDCDDADAARGPADGDGDGASSCAGDCDDADPAVHPAAADPWGDGADSNCDGVDGEDGDGDGDPGNGGTPDCDDADPARDLADLDGDGWSTCTGDCDDGDASLAPGRVDLWGDGVDRDCDGVDGTDADGDGYPGNAVPAQLSVAVWDCDDGDPALGRADADGDGVDACSGDCDDGDAAVLPGAAEQACDGIDSDCVVDPAELDGDGDGLLPCAGDCDDSDPAIDLTDRDGDGVPPCGGDCDDADPLRAPGLPDPAGDGQDTDCDGVDGVDADGDGYPGNVFPATLATPTWDCDDADPAANRDDADGDGFDGCSGDCDDARPWVLPGRPDGWGDGLDVNCDGVDGVDADGDGWAGNHLPGGLADPGWDCDDADPALGRGDVDGDGQDPCSGDCDDGDGTVFAGAADQACDGIDRDCVDDPAEDDRDGDGAMPCTGDCDDADPALGPDDADGDGQSPCDGDCDDADPARAAGFADPWGDGLDTNCDGVDGEDADGDGFAANATPSDLSNLAWDCDDTAPTLRRDDVDGDGFDPCQGDCDDGNPLAHPGLPDPWGDGLDADCDGGDGLDADGDGASADALPANLYAPSWDCDDGDPAANRRDDDGDGLDSCSGDCDDADPLVRPGVWEGWADDGVDSNCDGDDHVAIAALPYLEGDHAYGQFGHEIVRLGDLDGDGYEDVAISKSGSTGTSANGYGFIGIHRGGPQGLDPTPWTTLGVAIKAFVNGGNMISLSDLDGDGRRELAFGMQSASLLNDRSGAVYIASSANLMRGRSLGLTELFHVILGVGNNEGFGAWILAGEDLDGDGVEELLVRDYQAATSTYRIRVFDGAALAQTGLSSGALATWEAPAPCRWSGAMSWMPDWDGDGVAELLLGSPMRMGAQGCASDAADTDAGLRAISGESLLGGSPEGLRDVFRLHQPADPDVRGLGTDACALGDLDGDGFDELAISSPAGDYADGFLSGVIDVVSSAALLAEPDLGLATSSLRLVGPPNRSMGGPRTMTCHAITGDGVADLFVGTDLTLYNPTRAIGGILGYDVAALLPSGGLVELDGAALWAAGETGLGYRAPRLEFADSDGDGREELLLGEYRVTGVAGFDVGRVSILAPPP